MEKTLNCVYGSENTKAVLFVYEGWYVIEGSVNVNKSPYGFNFNDGVDVELIQDIDCYTATKPINSIEELKTFIDEDD